MTEQDMTEDADKIRQTNTSHRQQDFVEQCLSRFAHQANQTKLSAHDLSTS
jgi:hypothetical protein